MQRTPMTVPGSEKLKAELQDLKRVQRPAVVQAIAEARAHGDLKENAEYHAAKEQQGYIEARVRDIEAKLSTAQVIDVSKLPRDGRVVFGTTVEILNVDTEEKLKYTLVGEDEADLKQHKISIQSPIARALIGKHEGDELTVKMPSGETDFEILAVIYS